MLATPRIEVATPEDVEQLVQLRLKEGWYRNDRLLRALMEWDGGRILIVRAAALDSRAADPAQIIASTSAMAAGTTGVIGNVVVREGFRGAGLGRRIMEAALEWMRGRGVRSVLLDATTAGRPLYRKLGFVGTGPSWFAHAAISAIDFDALAEQAGPRRATVRTQEALGKVSALDIAAFGGNRVGLLERMLAEPDTWLFTVDDIVGAPAGYALVRLFLSPSAVVRLGPVIATGPGPAAALVLAACDEQAPWRSLVDARDLETCELSLSPHGASPDALSLAQRAGAQLELDDLIMQLDFPPQIGPPVDGQAERRQMSEHPEWLYGWLAPMVF